MGVGRRQIEKGGGEGWYKNMVKADRTVAL